MLDSRSQWVVGSALLDCWSSIHRLHWLTSGVESVAAGLMVWTFKSLPDTEASQTGCPSRSIHSNWYCLVTMLLGSLQTAKLGVALWKSHWNSTTTETKEDVFARFPDASHTIVKVLIFTGTLGEDSPWGTMPTETSPWLENVVVLPRSLIVMSGHDVDCALTIARRQASPTHIKNRDWTKSPLFWYIVNSTLRNLLALVSRSQPLTPGRARLCLHMQHRHPALLLRKPNMRALYGKTPGKHPTTP